MNREIVIEAEELVKRYGKIYALKGVSFKVYGGEIYGLLGPNGAGKTTTIRAIAGALKPSQGYVRVFGLDSFRDKYHVRKRIGVVPELPSLYPELTIYENLYFIGRIYGLNRDRVKERIRVVSERLGLEKILHYKYGRLSKGFKRRVDIAAALVHDPDILLLDEPTTGLDVLVASRLREFIAELGRMGKTIILSSHYIDEAMNLSDRVLLLYNGVKILEDQPEYLRRILQLDKRVRIYLSRRLDAGEANMVRKRLEGIDGIDKIDVRDRIVELHTKKPVEIVRRVEDLLVELGIGIKDIDVIPPSWEDIFRKFVEGYEGIGGKCGPCPLAGAG